MSSEVDLTKRHRMEVVLTAIEENGQQQIFLQGAEVMPDGEVSNFRELDIEESMAILLNFLLLKTMNYASREKAALDHAGRGADKTPRPMILRLGD